MRTRNILAALLLVVAGLQTAWAQKVVLNYTDGTKQKVHVSELQDITFEEAVEHEYVDLGLPSGTLWATCNIGANSPEEYGDYFAWGETSGYNSGKTYFSWATYKYWNATHSIMTKYCTDSSRGLIDNKRELDPEDDAATVDWGTDWQMPSKAQFDELIDESYTTTTWTTLNGVDGRMIVSKSNGNRVFLPAAGRRTDASLRDAGTDGYYWSRSLDSSNSIKGYVLQVGSSYNYTYGYGREGGRSVRPVRVVDYHEYVDLGLPSGTLWATCNIGAENPEDYGDYFAWGETEPKDYYDWATYKYCNGSGTTMTKYCTQSDYGYNGFTDNKTELEAEDDAATVNWGTDWQMPSLEQLIELIDESYTTTTWTTLNGVDGRMIVSKSNGNRMFLPAAGLRYDASLRDAGSYGYYWSRSLDLSDSRRGYNLGFSSSGIGTAGSYRYSGRSVRPVRVQPVTGITISKTTLSLVIGHEQTLTATVQPSNASNKNIIWSSSDANIATVDYTGKVTAVAIGTCTITATAADGSGVKAECQVTVTSDNSGVIDGREYVDLGLPSGTLWATCNIGANSPEEFGDYFAWGETAPKDEYNWSTYFDTDDDGNTFNKYNNDGGLTELLPEDDAATVNWGTDWQMPSKAQFDELRNSSYTTTSWTTRNGVNGYLIVSKSNGNRVFLPAAGFRYDSSLSLAGEDGDYWSRSLASSYSSDGYYLYINSSNIGMNSNYRFIGQSVRPVRVK